MQKVLVSSVPFGAGARRSRACVDAHLPRGAVAGGKQLVRGEQSRVVQFALQSSQMAAARHPLSLRLGHEGIEALEDLARRRGVSRAEAARQAITETAERERRRIGLAAEARALMEDKGYVSEAQDVVSLMEELRGPW